MPLTPWFALKASGCFVAIAVVVAARIAPTNHPSTAFGPANWVTMMRAALIALVAGAIGEPRDPAIAASAAAAAILATLMDGLDGWLARRSGMSSAFGARFDM